ncbi:MAG TPA: hypothetical protein DEG17_12120 [Cyanobacteria bacterium UBA11149]|nr:hypothetical protein [Cyanobacteria bacterium UBA11367]HBE60553.1 hypothetical protein [Cyanobacteria bacterium UBA11366]HBK63783.1 hypothetical protein [Cyanobacteria bacterium UBA11166]HBR72889.1 hypothetical protein [Cyanobacteria bacterium UBA11159]HBS69002.1 hypothetical protein [Cyanobacteria bacterium UBA11153]HBW89593.1 hypothetical protein [Cyanobacteria bacterium UBA11149]HCA93392.1 hypothetical protein [Cyanobacteria bacterium UBA9226]
MSKAQAKWSADGSVIPSINPHTKAKHLIIEKYIEEAHQRYRKERKSKKLNPSASTVQSPFLTSS